MEFEVYLTSSVGLEELRTKAKPQWLSDLAGEVINGEITGHGAWVSILLNAVYVSGSDI